MPISVPRLEKLSRLNVGALFMDMGTGKTRTAIELGLASQKAYFQMRMVLSCFAQGDGEKGDIAPYFLQG